ncbi:MAG TPA: hypothetical protein VF691_03305 [Cytophagaceae bacterium]
MKDTIVLIAVGLAIWGCQVQQPILDDSAQIAIPEGKEKGLPAMSYKNGSIERYPEDFEYWSSTSDELLLSKQSDTLKVFSNFTGDQYNFFSRKIPPLNFSSSSVLRVRAKAEGGSSPILRIALRDYNGLLAHEPVAEAKILNDGKYKEYFFDFSNKWLQTYPDTAKVDSTMINEILFFLNPGEPEYSGKLFIKEIQVVNYSRNTKAKQRVIDDFETRKLMGWWNGDKIALDLLEGNKNQMIVSVQGAGPGFENFGKDFTSKDISKYHIIKVKAKSEGEGAPELRIDLKDSQGKSTNIAPVASIIGAEGYKEYYFNYSGKYKQQWPEVAEVDSSSIVGFTCFVNGGKAPYSGKIFIQSIELVTEKMVRLKEDQEDAEGKEKGR